MNPSPAGPGSPTDASVRPVVAIDRIGFTTADLGRTRAFYGALGFVADPPAPLDAREAAHLGMPGARAERLVLRLGEQRIEVLAFEHHGRPYPEGSTSTDLWFQHIAIAVADMHEAYRCFRHLPGVVPITQGGPQRLPDNTGGVTAFKFRDPDGHPLELLAFPPGVGAPRWQVRNAPSPFLGIDHSAIAVGDLDRSMAWYGAMGLTPGDGSLNRGPAQGRLDDVAGDIVDVQPLVPSGEPTPHLELLAYRTGLRRPIPSGWRADDIAATRTIMRMEAGAGSCLLRDPDGHLVAAAGGTCEG